MEKFTLAELGIFLTSIGGILITILLTIQKSKCKTIKCCGAECNREIKNNEINKEQNNDIVLNNP